MPLRMKSYGDSPTFFSKVHIPLLLQSKVQAPTVPMLMKHSSTMTTALKPCSNPACNQSGTGSCGSCTKANYCSRSCQMADWCRHKEECRGCSNPGCDQPGTSSCASCGTVGYCCRTCQTADWPHHKEECPGHLRKIGKAHIEKAVGFRRERNWVQTIHYAELALTKLIQIKDRRLETVEIIDAAFGCKFNALQSLDRHREALECAKENYTLWAMNHIRNPKMFNAAFKLIQSCMHNEQLEDALLYAHTAHEMVSKDADGIIPSDQREELIAEGSRWLSLATLCSAQAGSIPPEEMQKAGEKAIALARQALEINTRLYGIEKANVAGDMTTLADVMDYFNDVDDDEVIRLYEQSIAIISRLDGTSSYNVTVGKNNLGIAYKKRAMRAQASNDLDRYMANLELALPLHVEAAQILRVINHMDAADRARRYVDDIEEKIRQIGIDRAVAVSKG